MSKKSYQCKFIDSKGFEKIIDVEWPFQLYHEVIDPGVIDLSTVWGNSDSIVVEPRCRKVLFTIYKLLPDGSAVYKQVKS